MRVINLDETGIKLLNNNKNQIYIIKEELEDFVKGKYILTKDSLLFNDKKLNLSSEEIRDFPLIIQYIKSEVLKTN
jgi:hypothetical protein